jgi:uncharacterized protein (DUF2141 family)
VLHRILLAGALALVTVVAHADPLASLTIHVLKVSPRGGDVRVALYTETTWSDDKADPVVDAVVPAKPGETIVLVRPVKPGTYGVKLFQDFNRNGEFDMTWYGYPLEKFGFSNDVRPTFSEPPFSAAKIELRPGANTITITLY